MIGDVKKTTKNLAQQAAKQVLQEPLEILRQTEKQVVPQPREEEVEENHKESGPSQEEEAKMKAQGKSQLAALEAELKDIRAKEEQRKAVVSQQEQAAQTQEQAPKPLVEPATKQGRRMVGVKRQQTHVEKILPPSG